MIAIVPGIGVGVRESDVIGCATATDINLIKLQNQSHCSMQRPQLCTAICVEWNRIKYSFEREINSGCKIA